MAPFRIVILISAALLAGICPVRAGADSSEVRCLVIPVQFADTSFTYNIAKIRQKVNGTADYFNAQFNGKKSFAFDIAPTVTLSRTAAFYGDNNIYGRDRKLGVMVYEACTRSDSEVDFSDYDNDGDGTVDRVFLICAGGNEAEDGVATSFWSQNWTLQKACHESCDYDKEYLKLDGCSIDSFSVTSEFKNDAEHYELTGIGMMCHEFGHFLGLKDMYDTDGELSGGLSDGLWGSISLMDRGNFNAGSENPPYLNAIEMDMLGIGTADTISQGQNILRPLGESGRYIRCQAGDGTRYFLECRKADGRDSDIGGSGLLIYRTDSTDNDAGYSSNQGRNLTAAERWGEINEVNCRPDRQCAMVITPASSPASAADVFFPKGETDFYGPVGPWYLSGIQLSPNGNISFQASSVYLDRFKADCYQDAVILSWHSSIETEFKLILDGETVADGIKPYRDGLYSYTIDGLKHSTEYSLELIPLVGQELRTKVTTRPYYVSVPAFIEFRSVKRNDDGSFPKGSALPLRVSSCRDIIKTSWTFNDTPITTGEDGYWHIQSGGTLKSVTTTSSGSTITVIKEITVK